MPMALTVATPLCGRIMYWPTLPRRPPPPLPETPKMSSNEKFCWLTLLNSPMSEMRLSPLNMLALPPAMYLNLSSVSVSASYPNPA